MEGEEERSENEGSFSKASIPKRIAIVIAGATVNIIFGLLVYFVLMSTSTTYVTNEISSVLDGYVAQEVGLQQNDKIVELDGKKIKNKYDLSKAMTKVTEPNDKNEKYNGEEISLKVERNGQTLEYQIKPTEIKIEIDKKENIEYVKKRMKKMGFELSNMEEYTNTIFNYLDIATYVLSSFSFFI